MARPNGSTNLFPSRDDLRRHFGRLKQWADNGDATAMAAVIQLSADENVRRALQEKRGGKDDV